MIMKFACAAGTFDILVMDVFEGWCVCSFKEQRYKYKTVVDVDCEASVWDVGGKKKIKERIQSVGLNIAVLPGGVGLRSETSTHNPLSSIFTFWFKAVRLYFMNTNNFGLFLGLGLGFLVLLWRFKGGEERSCRNPELPLFSWGSWRYLYIQCFQAIPDLYCGPLRKLR
jgi:hypothetical protein